jgi:hypothetical protein
MVAQTDKIDFYKTACIFADTTFDQSANAEILSKMFLFVDFLPNDGDIQDGRLL